MRTAENLRDSRMAARKLIWIAFGRHAAKKIEEGLGCSTAQAWRIVSSGHIPPHVEEAFYGLLDRTLAVRREEIRTADEVVRAFRLRRDVRAVEALAGATGGEGAPGAARSDRRPRPT